MNKKISIAVVLLLSASVTVAIADVVPEDRVILAATADAHKEDKPVPTPVATTAPAREVVGDMVRYGQMDGQDLVGYLVRPADADATTPALVVVHEWWGLNDNIRQTADRLAGEGYIALVADLYGGKTATIPKEAIKLMTALMADTSKGDENVRQAYRYLDEVIGAPRIGSIGWCMGGRWSLRAAVLLPAEIDATVIYYGNTTDDETELAPLQMPVLGNFASDDPVVKVESVHSFTAAMEKLGKNIDVKIYEGAQHGFSNPSGMAYNEAAAKDAWARTMAFLSKHLSVDAET
jgi:carboxymethylenebutenolidase